MDNMKVKSGQKVYNTRLKVVGTVVEDADNPLEDGTRLLDFVYFDRTAGRRVRVPLNVEEIEAAE